MIASVYDPGLGRYRYYKLRGTPGRSWQQPGSSIGTGVEDALPQLPLGSVLVGNGEDAIGQVLRPPSRGITLDDVAKAAAIGFGAFLLWRFMSGPSDG